MCQALNPLPASFDSIAAPWRSEGELALPGQELRARLEPDTQPEAGLLP